MITIGEIFSFPNNKKASIYLVDRDAYHNEENVMVATDVPIHYREQVTTARTYRPDKNIAETEAVEKIVYLNVTPENKEILELLKTHDIIEIDNTKYRIFDIYKGYSAFGELIYLKIKLL